MSNFDFFIITILTSMNCKKTIYIYEIWKKKSMAAFIVAALCYGLLPAENFIVLYWGIVASASNELILQYVLWACDRGKKLKIKNRKKKNEIIMIAYAKP